MPPKLYGIVDLGYVSLGDAPRAARDLLEGGVGCLQLRAKGWDVAGIRPLAWTLVEICQSFGVALIINDHLDLAVEVGADGLHLGQDDGALAPAREVLGAGKWIGRSTHSLAQARAALAEGFDYIGFGPLFATATKPGRPAIGLDEVGTMEREVGSRIPAYCIGGITRANLGVIRAAGARRVVMVSDLLQAPDRVVAVREACSLLES